MSSENRKTILLVEDEAIIAIAQKKTLEKYGYKVITANNGERAINVFRENDDIDLILMDIDLGKSIDGTEAAKRILAEHNLPVVFLSSHTEPEIVEKTEKITSYGYVVKNSGITVLDASIKMAFKLFDANKQIVESEIKQKVMISNISDVIAIIGADGIIKYKSPNIEKLFGWKPEDLIGTDGFSTVHPDDLEMVKKVFFDLLQAENSSKTLEYRYKCKDGKYVYIELTAMSLTGDPVVKGILLNYHDISERKKIEEALRDSEERFRKIFDDGQVGIVIVNREFRFENVNPAFCRFTGYSQSELLSLTFRDITHPDYLSHDLENMNKLKNGEIQFYQTDKKYIRKNGEIFWGNILVSQVYDKEGKFFYYLAVVMDINERRKTDEALLKSEERYVKTQRMGYVGSWEYNLQTANFWGSDEAKRIYGFDPEKSGFTTDEVENCIPERERVHQALVDLIEHGKDYNLEFEIHPLNGGEPRIIWSVAELLRDGKGNPLLVTGLIQDITERKHSEELIKIKNEELESVNEELNAAMEEMEAANEELIASSEDLQAKEKALIDEKKFTEALLECIPGYLYVYDDQGKLIRWNKKHEEMTGYSAEELSQMSMSKWFEGEDAVRVAAAVDEVFRTGYGEVEANLLIKGGKKLLIHSNGVRLTIEGKTYFTGVGVDITERKRAEEEIKKSQLLLKSSIESPKDIIILSIDNQYNYLYFNSYHKSVMKNAYGVDVAIGMNILDCITNDQDRIKAGINYGRALSGESHITIEEFGELDRQYYETRYNPIVNNQNVVIGATAFSANVTSRIRMQNELIKSERKFDTMFQTMVDGMVTADLSGRIIYANQAAGKILSIGKDVLGKDYKSREWRQLDENGDLYPLEQLPLAVAMREQRDVLNVEHQIEASDGERKWLSVNAAPLFDEAGILSGGVASFRDITERKIAEENVQKLLREKELLLREVHHRIKNNMNTIKGLLNLQADAQENPEIANVLFDAESRVISMMVLYDRLYRSDDYRIISIKDYIPALADEILSNFPSGKKVKIIKKLDDFVLDVKILQPLGIIINELLTNIMKYAFIYREDGLITVSSEIKGSHVSIIIHDNGVGIPESIEIENSTGFGMQLVGMLTEQIGGVIRIERGEGTKFILEFDV